MLQIPGAGIFHRHDLAEGIAGGQHALGEAAYPAVDRAHQRNALHQLLPVTDQLAANQVRDQQSRQQDHNEGEQHAQARQMEAQQGLRLVAGRQQHQGAIHQRHDEATTQMVAMIGSHTRMPATNSRRRLTGRLAGLCDSRLIGHDVCWPWLWFREARLADRRLGPPAGGLRGGFGRFRTRGLGCRAARLAARLRGVGLLGRLRIRLAVAGLAVSPAFASAGGVACAFASAPSLASPARLRLPSLSVLKSVSYQPPPLRRNTGAEISFFSVPFPQEGTSSAAHH